MLLNSMKNQAERTDIISGFIFSSHKVAKCFLELIRGHSPDEHNELVKQIEGELKNSQLYWSLSVFRFK